MYEARQCSSKVCRCEKKMVLRERERVFSFLEGWMVGRVAHRNVDSGTWGQVWVWRAARRDRVWCWSLEGL